jgi:excisionase family DNA binding protein
MENSRSVPSTDVSAVRLLLTIEEAAVALSLGRTFVYELVMRREIPSIKLGRKRRIPVSALNDFVARQLHGEA